MVKIGTTIVDRAKINPNSYQVSIPEEVREILGLKKGDVLIFLKDNEGRIFIRERNQTKVEI